MFPELNPIAPPGAGRTPGDGQLHVTFVNVGTGDCTYIICPNGKRILIDSGSKNKRGTSLQSISQALGHVAFNETRPDLTYLELDVLVLTHGHEDHNNLIWQMVGSSPIQRVYYGGNLQTDYASGNFWNWMGLNYNCLHAPQPLVLNTAPVGNMPNPILICDGTAGVLNSCWVMVYAANVGVTTPAMQANEHYRQNTNSIVTRVVFGADTIMICGDATIDTQNFLLNAYRGQFTARNLLIPHHGSDSSLSPGFIQAVDPQFAAISCVSNGRYNLPKKTVVDEYLRPTYPNGNQRSLINGEPNHNIDTYDAAQFAYVPTATTRNIWQTGAQNQSFTIDLNGQ